MDTDNKFQVNWITLDSETDYGRIYATCPYHLTDSTKEHKCAIIERTGIRGEDYILKIHGFIINDKEFEFDSLEKGKRVVENIFFRISASDPDLKKPLGKQPEPDFSKAYSYNMYQVMLQGTQTGNWVLVYNPMMGPFEPNAALNLSAWLRKYAEKCPGLRTSYDGIWNLIKDL